MAFLVMSYSISDTALTLIPQIIIVFPQQIWSLRKAVISAFRTVKTMRIVRLLFSYVPSSRYSVSSTNLLKSGDILKETRIFSNQDVAGYSKLSLDANPLHFDTDYARKAGFEDRLVPGMLVASLFPRIIASHFPGAVYASQTLHFKSPVYIEDEIVGELQATSIREMKKKYVVKFSTRCFKNNGLLVLDGEATALLPTLSVTRK